MLNSWSLVCSGASLKSFTAHLMYLKKPVGGVTEGKGPATKLVAEQQMLPPGAWQSGARACPAGARRCPLNHRDSGITTRSAAAQAGLTSEVFIQVAVAVCQRDGRVVGAQQAGPAQRQRLHQARLLPDGVRQPRLHLHAAARAHLGAHVAAVAPAGGGAREGRVWKVAAVGRQRGAQAAGASGGS